ncbi:hypothetical protein Tsp_07796, partial [Trichinella spiralis]
MCGCEICENCTSGMNIKIICNTVTTGYSRLQAFPLHRL